MNAVVITIGDELLNGQTIDTNSTWIAKKLDEAGISVVRILSIPDKEQDIISSLQWAVTRSELIVMTGGLGPTEDDVTKSSIAKYLGDKMVFSKHTFDRISKYCKKTGKTIVEAHRRQCLVPASAELLDNDSGSAPGMWMSKDDTIILSLPGVPHEMKGMMTKKVMGRLANLNPDNKISHFIVQTVGCGENAIAEMIQDIVVDMPDHLSVAYLPNIGSVKLRISAKGKDSEDLGRQVQDFGNRIIESIKPFVYGTGEMSLPQAVYNLCVQQKCKVGTAESCTGGRISGMITAIPGSSSYYKGSIIAYSNDVKKGLLNVSSQTLEVHGAVSEETVIEMVKGLIPLIDVDIGVAVSGIAGPEGGTPDKPVGTVWLAVGDLETIKTKKLSLARSRMLNIEYASICALDLLRRFILNRG